MRIIQKAVDFQSVVNSLAASVPWRIKNLCGNGGIASTVTSPNLGRRVFLMETNLRHKLSDRIPFLRDCLWIYVFGKAFGTFQGDSRNHWTLTQNGPFRDYLTLSHPKRRGPLTSNNRMNVIPNDYKSLSEYS
jgi:hypothetical protein